MYPQKVLLRQIQFLKSKIFLIVRTVAILQSNYLPWKGYFDIIHDADLFIFYDDLQYTKNDWRNRNIIKTPKCTEWLTVPVGPDNHRLICDVTITNISWQIKHFATIRQNYSKAPFFANYKEFLEDIYLGRQWKNLSELNRYLIRTISYEFLGITTEFADSRDYTISGKKFDRLMDLIVSAESNCYVSGPAAKDYVDSSKFFEMGIELIWKDYSGYPEYTQRYPPFVHAVSIIDLLFNVGQDAPWYIWGWREGLLRP
ncbi:MAG: WbqC family protein [Chlorobium sp.]